MLVVAGIYLAGMLVVSFVYGFANIDWEINLPPKQWVALVTLWPLVLPGIAVLGLIDMVLEQKHRRQLIEQRRRAALEVEYKKTIKQLETEL